MSLTAHAVRLLLCDELCWPQVGTLQYLAPEVLMKQPATYAADVYAWAVTVNEVATHTFPFSDCTRENPQAHTVLDFGYGRSGPLLSSPHTTLIFKKSSGMCACAWPRAWRPD